MNRGHLYIFIIAASVMFMAFPETVIHPFLTDSPIQLNVYAWIHLTNFQLVIQILLSLYDSKKDELIYNGWYLVFMCYNWIDFTLGCNTVYAKIGVLPISANVISVAGFFIVLGYMKWRTRENTIL